MARMQKRSYSSLLLLFVVLAGCRDGKRYHDVQQPVVPVVAQRTGLESILEFQEHLNGEFRNPDESPLSAQERQTFSGLEFFPPDTTYQTWARLVRSPQALPFDMPTTTDRLSRERQYGTLHFKLMGRSFSLEVYQSPDLIMTEGFEDYLFLPFTDLTNGSETYHGGRYMDLRIPSTDSVLLDFNRAYNPFCAYNPEFSCPIVPDVNHLDIPVRAGVKAYRK